MYSFFSFMKWTGVAATVGFLGVIPSFEAVGAPTVTLTAPSSLKATVVSYKQISLSWTRSNIKSTTKGAGYMIWRSLSSSGPFQLIDTASAGAGSYQDTDLGLEPLTTYYYQVQAYSGSVNSAFSNMVVASTPNTPPDAVVKVGAVESSNGASAIVSDGTFVYRVAGGSSVQKINPATNAVVASLAVNSPRNVYLGKGSLWVDSQSPNQIHRIDPSTMAKIATIDLSSYGIGPVKVGGLLATASYLIVQNYSYLIKISLSTNTVAGALPFADKEDSVSLATESGGSVDVVWATLNVDGAQGGIYHFNFADMSVIDHYAAPATASRLQMMGYDVWVQAAYGSSTGTAYGVYNVTSWSGAVAQSTFINPSAYTIVSDRVITGAGAGMFNAAYFATQNNIDGSIQIHQFSDMKGATDRVLLTVPGSLGVKVRMVSQGELLYFSTGASIVKVNTTNGAILQTIPVDSEIESLMFVGTQFTGPGAIYASSKNALYHLKPSF